jgi:hypothetical protein
MCRSRGEVEVPVGEGDDLIYLMASDLLTCAHQSLLRIDSEVATGAGARICVVPGASVAADSCCPGQLSVAVARIFPSTRFPSVDATQTPCAVAKTAVEFKIVEWRCVPTPTGREKAPSCEKLDETARLVLRDGYALKRGVSCCLADLQDSLDVAIGQLTLLGPDADCVGISMPVTIGFDDTCQCVEGMPVAARLFGTGQFGSGTFGGF